MSVNSILNEMARHELSGYAADGKVREEAGLKIVNLDYTGRNGYTRHVKIWRGKASKPYANYVFKSDAEADAYIAKEIAGAAAGLASKEAYKATRKADTAEAAKSITIGTLLCYSWGYDQTNVDFYEVVDKRGLNVALRKIAGESVSGSEGFMSCRVRPVKGAYCGEPFTKRISRFGVTMAHGHASPCAEGSEHYCSWYA